MSLFKLVEAIINFEKSSSDVELQKMLRICGLKKIDLIQLCKKSGMKSSRKKPELIECWRSGGIIAVQARVGNHQVQ